MDQLTIGQAAAEAGLNPSALRYYEHIGLLQPVPRENGRRRYAAQERQRLQMIVAAKRIGFSLDEIKILLDGVSTESRPSKRWQYLAEAKLPAIAALIQQANAMKHILQMGMNCQCIDIEACFEHFDD